MAYIVKCLFVTRYTVYSHVQGPDDVGIMHVHAVHSYLHSNHAHINNYNGRITLAYNEASSEGGPLV